MEELSRFSVSVPAALLLQLDAWIQEKNFPNRSEGLRQLIRHHLAECRWEEEEGESYGSLTILYNHHGNAILNTLTSLQHDYEELIVCTTHVHMDHDHCMEVLVLKGDTKRMAEFILKLSNVRGILAATPTLMRAEKIDMP